MAFRPSRQRLGVGDNDLEAKSETPDRRKPPSPGAILPDLPRARRFEALEQLNLTYLQGRIKKLESEILGLCENETFNENLDVRMREYGIPSSKLFPTNLLPSDDIGNLLFYVGRICLLPTLGGEGDDGLAQQESNDEGITRSQATTSKRLSSGDNNGERSNEAGEIQTDIDRHNLNRDLGYLRELLDQLKHALKDYNDAVFQCRQYIGLKRFDPTEGNPGLDSKTREERTFRYDEYNFVSLDPCDCPPECPPQGIRWLLKLPDREQDPQGWIGKLFLVILLAMLPTASILVLYVIPSTYGRIGAIVGQSAILTLGLAVYDSKAKRELVSYMLGMAAVQVVFVGSVLNSV